MTTIAVKDNIMASDGRMTLGDMVLDDECTKVVDICGVAVGGAGDICSIIKFREWFTEWLISNQAQDAFPEVTVRIPEDLVAEDFVAVVLYPGGRVFNYYGGQKGGVMEVSQPTAIGSGTAFALAAMDAGASAREAIEVAMKRDVYSGGKIVSIEVSNEEEGEPLTREALEGKTKKEILEALFPKENDM